MLHMRAMAEIREDHHRDVSETPAREEPHPDTSCETISLDNGAVVHVDFTQLLGAGSRGTVWHGSIHGGQVAVKFDRDVQHLRRSIHALKLLSGVPSVPTFAGTSTSQCALAMELLGDSVLTLADESGQRGSYLLAVLPALLDALTAIHARRVWHGDVRIDHFHRRPGLRWK